MSASARLQAYSGALSRILAKPPAYVAERALRELRMWAERYTAPRRLSRRDTPRLARLHGHAGVDAWWAALGARAYPANTTPSTTDQTLVCEGEAPRVIEDAKRACAHEVSLLGSGRIDLGPRIDWCRDYKSGYQWPLGYCRDLEFGKRGQRADVKFPWELSRMQWLVPAGQAYLLTNDERYARAVRAAIESWIDANPYARSINWSCTMEVALRIVTWTWFFHVFRDAAAWKDAEFRASFLRTLYFHADFTARHLEKADVNGNHYTANAAGLVYAGLFFGGGGQARKWLRVGWRILREELPKQVFADGVDYEGSIAYHRLVLELFLLPALYLHAHGIHLPDLYRERLIGMARFTAAYSRADGTVPLVGDADDARVLPFGAQGVNDHRYLLGIVAAAFDVDDLRRAFSGPKAEVYWLLGAGAADALPSAAAALTASM